MPSLVPGWLMPSWLAPESASPRDAARQQRLRQLRRQLASSSRLPPLPLPLAAEELVLSTGGAAGEEGSGSTLDMAHGASNAVPFHSGSPAGSSAALSSLSSGGAAGGVCRAEEARQVLPWLYVVEGRLDFSALETLASQLALTGLQLLDVSRHVAASNAAGGHWHSSWAGHIRWAGPQALPSPAAVAAAALRRMELRRGGALEGLPEMDGKAVVVAFPPQHRAMAAEVLALYLHAYLGLSLQEAVSTAGNAVGAAPLESTLRGLMEELAVMSDGWYRRVTLAWPYTGGHVEIVGDAVGGWEQRAPMVFDVKRKRWHLQIWGLAPGIHRFKYLVDGRWVIDLAAHTEADSRSNINNVVMVTDAGRPFMHATPDEGSSSSVDQSDASGGPLLGPAVFSDESATTGSGGIGSSSEYAAVVASQQQQGAAGGVLATAEPQMDLEAAAPADADGAGAGPPWSNDEEMEKMARLGAALLALHTRMGVQLRHMLH